MRSSARFTSRGVPKVVMLEKKRSSCWSLRSKLFWPEERPDVIAEEALRLWGLA